MASLDLVALWAAHCRYEFETRDVDATMATMVVALRQPHPDDDWRRRA
jgi:carboxymethylenebutenolidase